MLAAWRSIDGKAVEATTVVAGCFDISAVLGGLLGRMNEAARLLGAADRLYEELGSSREGPYESALYARTIKMLQGSLGPDVFASERELGRTFSLEDATTLGFALAEGTSPSAR